MPQSSFIPGGDLRLVVGDRTVAYFPAGTGSRSRRTTAIPDKFTARHRSRRRHYHSALKLTPPQEGGGKLGFFRNEHQTWFQKRRASRYARPQVAAFAGNLIMSDLQFPSRLVASRSSLVVVNVRCVNSRLFSVETMFWPQDIDRHPDRSKGAVDGGLRIRQPIIASLTSTAMRPTKSSVLVRVCWSHPFLTQENQAIRASTLQTHAVLIRQRRSLHCCSRLSSYYHDVVRRSPRRSGRNRMHVIFVVHFIQPVGGNWIGI